MECHQLHIVAGAVATLYQQVIVGAPQDHRNRAAPGQQRFVWFKCVPGFSVPITSGPGTQAYGVPYSCLYTLAFRRIAWTYSRVSVKGIDSTNSCGSRYFPWASHSSTRSDPAL